MVSEGLLVALSPLKLETLLLCPATITVATPLSVQFFTNRSVTPITTESEPVTDTYLLAKRIALRIISLDVVPSVEAFERNILDDNLWSDHL
jgi:hypothetical protein